MRVVVRAGDALTWLEPIPAQPIISITDETEAVLSARKKLAERYARVCEHARRRLDIIESAPTAVEALRRVYGDAE